MMTDRKRILEMQLEALEMIESWSPEFREAVERELGLAGEAEARESRKNPTTPCPVCQEPLDSTKSPKLHYQYNDPEWRAERGISDKLPSGVAHVVAETPTDWPPAA